MRSTRWSYLPTIILLLFLAACDGSQQTDQISATPALQKLGNKDQLWELEPWVIASGTLTPVGEVEVGSEVSGRIAELLVDFNDTVHQDQIIARIDPKSFEAQLRQAEAALLDARATIEISEATLLKSSRSLERIRGLHNKQATSEDVLDEAEAAVQIAHADLDRARAVASNREAALEEAKVALSRTLIRAPIDGVVISREVTSGQTVAASMEAPKLFKIARTLGEMEIHARIDEADIGQIHVHQQAKFTVPAHGDRPFEARVTQVRVAPIIVDNVVTYTVVLLAENRDALLLPGMTAVVEIGVEESASIGTGEDPG